MRQYGIIYKATSPNGKAYIGQTTKTLAHRRGEHQRQNSCRLIAKAIRKYGDAIEWQIIARAPNKATLDLLEITAIAWHGTLSPDGYNLRDGGGSGKHTAEARDKMSTSHKGQVAWNKGIPRDSKTRAKLRAANLGKKHTAATREKLRAIFTGRIITPEWRAKQSDAAKRRYGRIRNRQRYGDLPLFA